MPNLKHLLRNIFRKKRVEADLDAEIRFYRETVTEQRMAAGMSEEEARRAARLEMGSDDSVKESVRDVRAGAAVERIWQDVRYAIRGLRNKPGFTVAAVLVLALGIGANSAVFNLVDAFLLKPIDVAHPEQLVGLYRRDTKHPNSYRAFSYANYVEMRDHNPIFSKLMAHRFALVGVEDGNETRRTFADIVSSNYFSALGVPLLKGRPFSLKEEKTGQDLAAIVTYSLWMRRGGDPHILGKKLRINGHLFTVIGITPKGFTGTTALVSPGVFLPLGAGNVVRDYTGLILVGRLKPVVTQEKANAKLAVFASQTAKEFPAENKDQMLYVHSLSRLRISARPADDSGMRLPAALSMLLAGVVLLIACLNLANMMMASGTARRNEIAIRLAIGGSRMRIVQQLVTEGFILALLGGAVGLFVASWSATLLMKSMAHLIVPAILVYNPEPDPRVLAGTLALCLLGTVVFGLFPAWKLTKADTWLDLKANGGGDVGGRTRRFFSGRNVLVIAQLSLSLMMLTAAGLFVRSAVRAANIRPGFLVQNEVLAEVDAGLIKYDETHTRQLYNALRERLERIPGVQSVATAVTVPFGMRQPMKSITPSNTVTSREHPPLDVKFNVVSADYFRTLGIPLLRGRPFRAAQNTPASKSNVAILDKLAAERLWPGGNAVGKHIRLDGESREVVGLVGNVRGQIFGESTEPHVYIPVGQQYPSDEQMIVRVAGGGLKADTRVLETIGREIRATDPRLPLLGLKTMRENVESSFGFWVERTAAHILEIFGAVALFLAVIGLYAVSAYTVARRTREIGIRMALGADASSALRMILGQGLRVIAIGIAIGLLLSIAAGRALAGFLYNTPGIDPLVLAAACFVLSAVALVACYLPARKASRVDPMVALRYE